MWNDLLQNTGYIMAMLRYFTNFVLTNVDFVELYIMASLQLLYSLWSFWLSAFLWR